VPYVRMRVSGTLGWFDRPVLRDQRYMIADDPQAVPPDRLVQQLIGLGIVEIDPDQAPPAPPAPVHRSRMQRLRDRVTIWRRNRAHARLLRQSPFRNATKPVLAIAQAAPPTVSPRSAIPGLWLPGGARPTFSPVVECPAGCTDAATCTHVRP